jgi:hypothetical protein
MKLHWSDFEAGIAIGIGIVSVYAVFDFDPDGDFDRTNQKVSSPVKPA